MMVQFTRHLVAAVTAGMVLSMTACAAGGSDQSTPDASTEPVVGGTAIIASLGEMPGFDPVRLVAAGSGIERAAAVMDTLLVRDEADDSVHPKLAESMESEDGRVWVMTLREGVTFTDGEPLNADAVVFNIDRHLAPDSPSRAKALLSGIDSVEATGEYEVTFTLKAPSGAFPIAFTGSSPASLIGSPAALADPEAFNRAPIGAGPFVMDEWRPDDALVLSRNESYWDEGKPYLDGAEFRVLTDPQTRVDSLLAGSVDLGLVLGPQWNLVSGNPELVLNRVQAGGEVLVPNASRAPGNDARVREAIGIALDGKTTATLLTGGTEIWDGSTDCFPFRVGSPACVEGLAPEPDPERAAELVAEYIADGGDPTIELVYASAMLQSIAVYFQESLNAIGLDVQLRALDLVAYTEAQAKGDYGLVWGSTASAAFPTVWTRLSSTGTNWGRVTVDGLDDALLRARDELELADRNAAWQDVARIVDEESVLTWVGPYPGAMVHQESLHLGTAEKPYDGSTMIYLDSAWLAE